MNFAVVALVGFTVGQAPAPAADYYPMNSRNIKIPIRYEKDRRSIRQVKLYVARNGENTWYQEGAVPPDRDFFTYVAKEDGIYWFTMVEEDLQGRNIPADLTRTPPDLKVLVDTTPPRVRFTSARKTGEEVVVEWFVDDKYPDENATRVHFRPSGSDGPWQEVLLPASSRSGVRFPSGQAGPVVVRVTAYDLAGNKAEAFQEVGASAPEVQTGTSQPPGQSTSVALAGAAAPAAPTMPEAVPAGPLAPPGSVVASPASPGVGVGNPMVPSANASGVGVTGPMPATASAFVSTGPLAPLPPPGLTPPSGPTPPPAATGSVGSSVSPPLAPVGSATLPGPSMSPNPIPSGSGVAPVPPTATSIAPSVAAGAAGVEPVGSPSVATHPVGSPSVATHPVGSPSVATQPPVPAETSVVTSPSGTRPAPASGSVPVPLSGSSHASDGTTPVAVWTSGTMSAGSRVEDDAVQFINFWTFELGYEIESRGPSGISRLDLWVTRDDGRTWVKWSQHDAKGRTVRVNLNVPGNPEPEGRYGFRVVPVSGAGLSEREPVSGDAPDLRVVVDVTPPTLELFRPVGDPHHPDTLLIRWKASDRNFGEDPITIEWSDKPTGPWQPVATGEVLPAATGPVTTPRRLPNTGQFAWQVPVGLPPRVYLKLAARDAAGNVREVVTRDPVLVDLVKPRARISGILTPAGGVRP